MRHHFPTSTKTLAAGLRLAGWLALAGLWGSDALAGEPALRSTPTLWLIGDSTVKNGRGDGAGGLWGWGQVVDAPFIDLNELVARRYEAEGEERVSAEFFTATDHTHTTRAGAEVNAACIAKGIRLLTDCTLRNFLIDLPVTDPGRASGAARGFDFGDGNPTHGYLPVAPDSAYSEERGYGWLPATETALVAHGSDGLAADSFITGDGPFLFSIAVPEGNYRVTVTLGDPAGASCTTVKAESRRLMLENIRTGPGERVTHRFTVNVRTPAIPGGGTVRLKEREHPCLHWDNKLTIEFNGSRPCIAAMVIAPAPDAITVYLAGDSTVTDQPHEPWNSWGQMLPRFFESDVAVANHAESGESIRSSLGARRFDKIFSTLRAGDYLFLQFGHNDMKDRATDALETYRGNLVKLVRRTREQGGTPVLITSMERKAGVERDTLGDYPRVVREVAEAEKAALIDLHAMSKALYLGLGSRLDDAFQDGTHHNNFGSYLLARCVVEGIRGSGLDLADHLTTDLPPFDPVHPEPPETFAVPPSPAMDLRKPDGN